jgi:hypothetical protein
MLQDSETRPHAFWREGPVESSHLLYAFFENGTFTAMLQIGDKQVPSVEAALPSLLPKTQEYWQNRYPCGERGGWIHYRVLADDELDDMLKLLAIRRQPAKI